MTRSAKPLWRQARRTVLLPTLQANVFNELEYASLVYDRFCMVRRLPVYARKGSCRPASGLLSRRRRGGRFISACEVLPSLRFQKVRPRAQFQLPAFTNLASSFRRADGEASQLVASTLRVYGACIPHSPPPPWISRFSISRCRHQRQANLANEFV